jgi:hypothetical protein
MPWERSRHRALAKRFYFVYTLIMQQLFHQSMQQVLNQREA